MDGATVAERICPWRRSSIPDGATLSSSPPRTHDPAINEQTSSNITDPNLHSTPLTSANYSGAYQKSHEYLGDYATTTKPEEHVSRPNIRDLFKNSDEKQEKDTDTTSNESTTHL
jgi:hypothetical protein